jgi:S1-C subfamily serine protease
MIRTDLAVKRAAIVWLLALLLLSAGTAWAAEGPRLGLGVQDIPSPRLELLGLSHGVAVHLVVPGSPADQAGVRPGDVLIDLGGAAVYSAERLQWLVSQQATDEPVTLRLRRGGEEAGEAIEVQIIPRLPDMESPPPEAGGTGQPPSGGAPWLGIRMQPLTEALRDSYGVPEGQGVLIVDVETVSPAAEAGLRAGDVLTRIDRRQIRGPWDVYRALNFFNPGDRVELRVIRGDETQTLAATLGRSSQPGGVPFGHPFWHPGLPGRWLEPRWGDWPGRFEELLELWRRPPPAQQAPPFSAPEAHKGIAL